MNDKSWIFGVVPLQGESDEDRAYRLLPIYQAFMRNLGPGGACRPVQTPEETGVD